jgi:excinuclease UvrABC nuclease subunit
MDQVKGCSVYLYYAANGRLVYVGVTDRGTRRMHEHADSKPWWPLVAGCAIEHYTSRTAALAREKFVIERYRPVFNVQHNPDGSLPLEEKIQKAVGWTAQSPVPAAGVTAKERKRRRQRYAALTSEQKKTEPCVECGMRPDPRGRGTCPSCRAQEGWTRRGLTVQ